MFVAGDANTLSPMEPNNRNVIKNNENSNKADIMTMSTPPHLLSSALGNSQDGELSTQHRRYYNHRSKLKMHTGLKYVIFVQKELMYFGAPVQFFFHIKNMHILAHCGCLLYLTSFCFLLDQTSDLWFTFGDDNNEEGILCVAAAGFA